MPKIIVRCNYLRNSPSKHLNNFVKYIATRDGVEKINLNHQSNNLQATSKQKKFISEIVSQFYCVKNMHEYKDYLQSPTMENATEFIDAALENNLDVLAKKENYIHYIANRPRVQKIGKHGLFSDEAVQIDLEKTAEKIANHKGIVWTNVISIKREDAVRLGYDNAQMWMNLVRSKRAELAKEFGISQKNFRWYAAFHNESHHPHIHLTVFSEDAKQGWVTKNAINNMRKMFAHEIFARDFENIYEKQNQARSEVKKKAQERLQQLIEQMKNGRHTNENVEKLIIELSKRLKHTKGKRQYGYLTPRIKNIVDMIVDELSKDKTVAEAYKLWYELRCEIFKTYADKVPDAPHLSRQRELKSIKNIIIKLADENDFEDEIVQKNQTLKQQFTTKSNTERGTNSDGQTSKGDTKAQKNPYKNSEFTTATAYLLHLLADLFEETIEDKGKTKMKIDRKRLRELRRKKNSQGQAWNDEMQSIV